MSLGCILTRAEARALRAAAEARYLADRDEVEAHAENQTLLRKYGISRDELERRITQQGGRCAICLRPFDFSRRLNYAVDHDHRTGTVRGILCRSCNTGLGMFGDSPRQMERAKRYLVAHRSTDSTAPQQLLLPVVSATAPPGAAVRGTPQIIADGAP